MSFRKEIDDAYDRWTKGNPDTTDIDCHVDAMKSICLERVRELILATPTLVESEIVPFSGKRKYPVGRVAFEYQKDLLVSIGTGQEIKKRFCPIMKSECVGKKCISAVLDPTGTYIPESSRPYICTKLSNELDKVFLDIQHEEP